MSEGSAVRRFFAGALMAVGGLLTVLCGGCTIFLFGSVVIAPLFTSEGFNSSDAIGFGLTAIIVGGVPTIVGVALFIWGRRMKRRVDAQSPRNLDNDPRPFE